MTRYLRRILAILRARRWSPSVEIDRSGRPTYLDDIEREAGRLIVEAARIRAARCGPDDAHELRHLWAAINAGNSDPCGDHGERCHLDASALREWTAQYPRVMGLEIDRSGRGEWAP